MVHLTVGRVWVLAVACASILPLATGASLPVLGDAGTTSDAGNSRAQAMPLAYGAYQGNLTPGDADWFALPAAADVGCLDVAGMAQQPLRFAVATQASEVLSTTHEGVLGSVIAVGAGPVTFAALPDESPWSALSAGPYSFALARGDPWAMGDGRRADAPSTVALAAEVPAECFGAVFRHDGPDIDVWTFAAAAGELVTYSFAVGPGATGVLEVLAPDGTAVVRAMSNGESGTFLAGASGTYAVRATSLSSWDNAEYVVGIVVGPEPTGCRPYCLATG